MRTITITIPEDLDDQAAAEARRLGISKSQLIRDGLAAVLSPQTEVSPDPWTDLGGFGPGGVGAGPGEIDDVVYGR